MPKRTFDPTAPYQSISGASRLTGLAQGYIRDGCRNGRIPCLRVGQEYRVCMRLFLQQLEGESAASVRPDTKKALTGGCSASEGGDGNGNRADVLSDSYGITTAPGSQAGSRGGGSA